MLSQTLLPDGTEYTIPIFSGMDGVVCCAGAAIVFFAFIGFDAVSTAAQEAKNPQKDMPMGILGSLVICTLLYVLFSWVLTGVAPYTDFVRSGKEASVAYAIETYMTNYHWLAKWITVGILARFLFRHPGDAAGTKPGILFHGQRWPAAQDIFSTASKISERRINQISSCLFLSELIATLLPGDITGDLTSIGTLLAFVLVCVGIVIMRKKDPEPSHGHSELRWFPWSLFWVPDSVWP